MEESKVVKFIKENKKFKIRIILLIRTKTPAKIGNIISVSNDKLELNIWYQYAIFNERRIDKKPKKRLEKEITERINSNGIS